jgi:hypothetical protein
MIPVDQTIREFQGPTLAIDCPNCHERRCPATSLERRTEETLAFVMKRCVSTHWVTCSRCGAALRSRVPVAELAGQTPEQLRDVLFPDASPIVKVVAIAAVPCAPAPGLGLALAVVATALTSRVPAWPRTTARFALFLSILAHLAWGVLIVLGFLLGV